MPDSAKCAHVPCGCAPAGGKPYCGEYCEAAAQQPLKSKCECGHPACTAITAPLVEPGLIPQPAL